MNYYHEELKPLVGRKIVSVRPFVKDELEDFAWSGYDADYAVVITLDDGTQFVPMRDEEGNGAGVLAVILAE